MACDLRPSIERMRAKLMTIVGYAGKAFSDICNLESEKMGIEYMLLNQALGKIAVEVRDSMSVQNYWYAKFVEDGVLKPCEDRTGRDPTPGVATDRRDSAGREGTPGTGEYAGREGTPGTDGEVR